MLCSVGSISIKLSWLILSLSCPGTCAQLGPALGIPTDILVAPALGYSALVPYHVTIQPPDVPGLWPLTSADSPHPPTHLHFIPNHQTCFTYLHTCSHFLSSAVLHTQYNSSLSLFPVGSFVFFLRLFHHAFLCVCNQFGVTGVCPCLFACLFIFIIKVFSNADTS